MAKLFNRAKMDTSTTGSGTITLGSAVDGYQSFADAGVADSDVVQYVIEDGTSWEIGTGTYSATGTSLTRTPSESSNSGSAISLTGAAEVFISAIHSDFERLQNAGTTKVEATSTGATVTGDIAVTGTVDGRDIASDGSKLDGIESGATADQTKADIDALGINAATADKWTTARTLSLSGDASGSVSWDGSANATLSVSVANDSHTHDGRYYTESEADNRFVNVTGDTMTGNLTIDQGTAGDANLTLRADTDNNDEGDHPSIRFKQDGDLVDWRIGIGRTDTDVSGNASNSIFITSLAGSHDGIRYSSDGTTSYEIWHQGNDGSGSGLDADTLDGVQASSFLRSDANDTLTGNLQITGDLTVSANMYLSDTSTKLTEGSADSLKIQTTTGYVDIGSMNTSWCHFQTDRGKFYFNKELRADGILGVYNQNTYLSSDDLYLNGQIFHYGDTDTYMQFHAANQWRVVAGGVEQLEVNTTRSQFAGHVRLTSGHYFERLSHNSGHLVGSYNSVGVNNTRSNPIYTIGSSYNPAASTLSNMYGIGYSNVAASFLPFSGGWGMYVAADGDARVWLSGSSGHVYATGDVRTAASDARLKTNVQEIPDAVEKVKAIRGVTFDWVDDIESEYDFHPMDKHDIGVIAQEVEAVLPELVDEAPFNGNYTEKTGKDHGFRTVRYDRMVALLIEAVKEQQTQIDALTAQVEELKRQ